MRSTITAGALAIILLTAALFLAGFASNMPTAPPPPATQPPPPFYRVNKTTKDATSTAITDSYTKAGYDVVRPFSKGTNQYGNIVYAGVVKDKSSSHVNRYVHNITVELVKTKTETTARGSQLKGYYAKQGWAITNLRSNLNYISKQNDSTGAQQLVVGLCDPDMSCISYYTFDNFTVIVDQQTKTS